MFCTPMFPPGTYISPRSRQKVLQQSVSHLHRHPTPLYATFHPNTGLGVYVGHSQSLCVSLSTTIRAQKMRRPHRPGPYLGGCVSTVCSNPFGSGSFVCPKCPLNVDTNPSDTALPTSVLPKSQLHSFPDSCSACRACPWMDMWNFS